MIELVNIIDYLEFMKRLNNIIKSFIFICLSLCMVGCSKDDVYEEKEEYLKLKEELLNKKEFTNSNDINFDINFSFDKLTEEEISYRAIIDNPKENMYDVKAILVHEYFSDDIFPSIGIFDDKIDLLLDGDEIKGFSLVGYISNTKEINDLNIRLYLEYKDDNNELKKIYYNSTN